VRRIKCRRGEGKRPRIVAPRREEIRGKGFRSRPARTRPEGAGPKKKRGGGGRRSAAGIPDEGRSYVDLRQKRRNKKGRLERLYGGRRKDYDVGRG